GDGGVDVGQAQAGLRVAEGQLRQAQQALLIARTKSTGDVETAEAAVEQATVGLTAAHNRANQAETTLTLTEQSTLSSITTAQQAVNQAQQQVAMLQTGARTQERGQSASALVAAQANLRTAQADYDRAKMLFDGGAVARATMDAAELRLDSAREQAKQAELADSLVIEGPRVEQVAIAQAQLASAQDQLNLAQTSRESTLSLRRDDLANAREGVTQAEAQLRQAQAAASTARAARAQAPIAEADVANAEQGVESARQALRLAETGGSHAETAPHEATAACPAPA
ncbi:MAG TPA: hypothetical protein DCZ72_06775, partial [Armatimonadetes bacterium]|nr:hypothetical protein [Armatimonadota bacterium]